MATGTIPEKTIYPSDAIGESADVVEWRRDMLCRAGYASRPALTLALTKNVDLHRACEMLAQGCSPELAVQILL